ncbi:hypothetical protein ANO14919_033360 [Xylariales sp. No.14919]|nr:hypothetical protein ANO14919_033360 [Xylariales sp. No.14919]
MARILGFAALSLLAALPPALGGSLRVYNSCNFKFWCSSAKNDGTSTATTEVLPGQWYTAEKQADNDNIGAVLKCALNSYNGEPYQVELAVQNGKSWLDLSAVDGHPFLAYHRHAEIPGVSGFFFNNIQTGVSVSAGK